MTVDVTRNHSAALAVRHDNPSDLVEWARSAHEAHAIAQQLCETAFVPKSMFRRPGEVTGAILAGRELGLSPMSALAAIDIIDGTPALRAHALRGLVQAHGHEVWVEESTETRAIVCGKRTGSNRIEKSTWTLDRAKKANLAGKKNWLTHPTAMLIARATSEVCRLIAADVLLGMPYSAEEIGDGGLDQVPTADTPNPPKATRGRTAQRALPPPPPPPTDVDFDAPPPEPQPDQPAMAVDDDPPWDQDQAPEPEPELEPELEPDPIERAVEVLENAGLHPEPVQDTTPDARITDPQRKRLAVAFRQAGIDDRAERLRFASEAVGRLLASSAELTIREASTVIRALVERAESR
jgi:hypothetical protein